MVGIKMPNWLFFPHRIMDEIKIICEKHNCNEIIRDYSSLGTFSMFTLQDRRRESGEVSTQGSHRDGLSVLLTALSGHPVSAGWFLKVFSSYFVPAPETHVSNTQFWNKKTPSGRWILLVVRFSLVTVFKVTSFQEDHRNTACSLLSKNSSVIKYFSFFMLLDRSSDYNSLLALGGVGLHC